MVDANFIPGGDGGIVHSPRGAEERVHVFEAHVFGRARSATGMGGVE